MKREMYYANRSKLVTERLGTKIKRKRGMRVRKRRIFFVLALMLYSVFCMTGCGSEVKPSDISDIDDLEGKKIGVQIGTTGDIYVSDYEGDEAGTTVERYNKGNDAISSLKNGKIDCVIIDEEPAKAYVKRNSDLSILEEEFAVEEYAICISKKNTELKDEINVALKELKEEGTLQKIINSYINEQDSEYQYESPKGLTYENGELVMEPTQLFHHMNIMKIM